MTRDELLDFNEVYGDGSVIFLEPAAFDAGVIGMGDREGKPHLVYYYELLVQALAKTEFKDSDDPETDAIDWLKYNTLRSIPYMGAHRPQIIHTVPAGESEVAK